jgi:hypothetical protein
MLGSSQISPSEMEQLSACGLVQLLKLLEPGIYRLPTEFLVRTFLMLKEGDYWHDALAHLFQG